MEVVVKVEEVAVRVNTPVQGRDRSVFVALSQVIAMFMNDSPLERRSPAYSGPSQAASLSSSSKSVSCFFSVQGWTLDAVDLIA